MKSYNVTFTKNEIEAAAKFLGRVNIQGAEAPALIAIFNALKQAKEITLPKPNEKANTKAP